MADDSIIVSISADVSGLTNGMAESSAALSKVGKAASDTGAEFTRQGAAFEEAKLTAGALTGSVEELARGFSKLAAESPVVSAALRSAIPIIALVAAAEVFKEIATNFGDFRDSIAKAVREDGDLATSSYKVADSIQLENLKLQDQIDKLEVRPAQNRLKEAILEDKAAAEDLSKSLSDTAQKSNDLLTVGAFGQLFSKASGDEAGAKERLQPILDQISAARLALAQASGSDQTAAAIQKQVGLYGELNKQLNLEILNMEAAGTRHGAFVNADSIAKLQDMQVAALNAASALRSMNEQAPLRAKVAGLEQQKDIADTNKEWARTIGTLYDDEEKLTRSMLEGMAAVDKNREVTEAAKLVSQQMEEQQRLLAQAEKDATTAAIQHASQVAEAVRIQQDAMREQRAQVAAGNVGPFAKMAGTAEDIRQLQELGQEINKVKVEMNDLSIAKSQLADKSFLTEAEKDQVNQISEKYRQLSQILAQLQAQYGEMQVKVGTASQTFQKTAQTAFDGINQSVIKFLETGKSFGRDMQQVWNQLASTVIENLMRMAEQMIINLILQKALTTGIAGATGGVGGIFKGLLGFADGGIVPGSGGQAVPIIAHGGEMVLPQNITNYVMARANNNSSANASGASSNVHLHTNVNTFSSSGFKEIMESNAHTLGRVAASYMRRRA